MGQAAMITTIDIIDRLKAVKGWSDYRTARELEITPQAVSSYRNKGRIMEDEIGVKAAKLLGLPADLILVSLQAERSLNSPAFAILDALAAELANKKSTKAALKKLATAAGFLAPLLYMVHSPFFTSAIRQVVA